MEAVLAQLDKKSSLMLQFDRFGQIAFLQMLNKF